MNHLQLALAAAAQPAQTPSPDATEPLLFRHERRRLLLDGGALFAPAERVRYLQADLDLLGERARLEDGLHLWHDRAGHHAALGADRVNLPATKTDGLEPAGDEDARVRRSGRVRRTGR